jgi:F0F1-type ATP synthase membrane subunit b/b'
MDPVLEGLINQFQELDDKSQERVVKKLKQEGENDLVQILKKLRRIKKRGERMDDLVDQILDKLE